MRIIYLVMLICFLGACQEKTPESRSNSVANEVCACATELLELNKQAADANGTIDFEGIQAAFSKTRACIAKQHLKADDRPNLLKALELQCPQLAAEPDLLEELLSR